MIELVVKNLDISYGGMAIVLNEDDARILGVRPYDRVKISHDDRSIISVVTTTRTFIKRGEIGLFREVTDVLKVSNGDVVKVNITRMPHAMEFIRKKLKGKTLTKDEIYAIVKSTVSGELTELECAAFLLAQEFQGMSVDEIVYLTQAMVETGDTISFEETTYDIHSIGGVPGNSKVALLEVPMVASAGLLIPKTSSRAITSPAGSADTMEVLANVTLTADEIRSIAPKVKGLLIWGGYLNLAPADDIFIKVEYPLRIDPRSQTIASILSKKLSMGVSYLVMDLPVGKGAKLESIKDAESFARIALEVGEKLGLTLRCAITYGGQPIGYSIGPALEAREALVALQTGKGAMSLIEKAASLAGLIFEMAGVTLKGEGINLAKELLYNGKAWKKMREMIEAQGGDPNVKPEDIPIGEKKIEIRSVADSYVTHVDNTAITLIARTAGAPTDKGAGIILHVKAGRKVRRGDILMEIYSESSSKLTEAYNLYLKLHPITLEGMLLKSLPE